MLGQLDLRPGTVIFNETDFFGRKPMILGGIWGCVGQRDQARKTWRPIWWWRGAYGQHRLMRWRWIWFLKKAIDSEKRNQWLFSKSILRPYMTI